MATTAGPSNPYRCEPGWSQLWMTTSRGARFPLTPTSPSTRLVKHVRDTTIQPWKRLYWCEVDGMAPKEGIEVDAEEVTRQIRAMYIGKIVYFETTDRMQPYEMVILAGVALLEYWKTGGLPGLSFGSSLSDLRFIDPRDLYEPAFAVTDIRHYHVADPKPRLVSLTDIKVIDEIVLFNGTVSDNVERVQLPNSLAAELPLTLIHKKMKPETKPDDMVLEADRYLALQGCECVPKLWGFTVEESGNVEESRNCRGLLIEEIVGHVLSESRLMFKTMKMEVTMKLVKAMVEIEKRNVYLQDLTPSNIIITKEEKVVVVDFGPGVTDGFYPEDELFNIDRDRSRVGIRVAMYGLLMTLRAIWTGGEFDAEGVPLQVPESHNCPLRLFSLLNDPQTAQFTSFQALEQSLRKDPELKNICL
jgi:hypothetical protein